MEDDLTREQQVLTAAIEQLKRARKQALGEITTLAKVVQLLEGDGEPRTVSAQTLDMVCERLSVVIDALAFHSGELAETSDTVHGVISLLSEVRQSLRA